MSQCPNCSAELKGEYCSVCGQPRIDPGDLSARRFFDDLSSIKLYFVYAALFFLAAPLAGFTLTSLIADDQSGDLITLVSARAAERGLEYAVFSQRFDLRVQSVYTLALGTGVIAVALMLQLLFRRAFPFGAHVIFALHYFSFLYLVTAAAGASRRFGLVDDAAAALAICLITTYLFLAMKRVYPGPIPSVVLKSAALLFLTLGFNYVADLGAIRLTLALI